MTTRHTLGPWKLEVNDKSGRAHVYGPIGNGNTRMSDNCGEIADIDLAEDYRLDAPMFPKQSQEFLANGRLIAAAPDLFESVREYCADNKDVPQHLENTLLRRARAALAKAEGRAP